MSVILLFSFQHHCAGQRCHQLIARGQRYSFVMFVFGSQSQGFITRPKSFDVPVHAKAGRRIDPLALKIKRFDFSRPLIKQTRQIITHSPEPWDAFQC